VVQLKNGGHLHSGLTTFGIGGEVLSRNRPQAKGSDSGQLNYAASYDALGRKTRETEGNAGGDTNTRSFKYDGSCVTTLLNDQVKSSSCTNLFGATQSQSVGSEEIAFDTSADGMLLEASTLGLSWSHTLHGEVNESSSRTDHADASVLSGTAAWDPLERIVREIPTGMELIDPYGFRTRFNSTGKLVSSEKALDTGAHAVSTDLTETRTYEKGILSQRKLIAAGSHGSGTPLLNQTIPHDPFGSGLGWQAGAIRKSIERDGFGRPVRIRLWHGDTNLLDLEAGFEDGRPSSLSAGGKPLVSEIVRDVLGRVTSYKLGAGLKVDREYHDLLAGVARTRVASATAFWEEQLTESPVSRQILTRNSTSSLRPQSQDSTETFSYDAQTYRLASGLTGTKDTPTQRDTMGRVKKLGAQAFGWNGELLSTVGGRQIYYGAGGEWVASCPAHISPTEHPERCVIKLESDVLLVEGRVVALIRFEGTPVALFYQGFGLYPVATDHLGSIRAEFSEDGKTVLWDRHYGAWGKKQVVASGADGTALEKLTPWSFAGLMELPGVESSLYWSRTRVYSPDLREWMSADPLVKWDPQVLLSHPGNWHAVRYAGGRPLEFVNPTGSFITIAPAFYAGVVAGGCAFAATMALDKSPDTVKIAATNAVISGVGTFITVASGGALAGLMAEAGASVIGANIAGIAAGNVLGLGTQLGLQVATGTIKLPALSASLVGTPALLAMNIFCPELSGSVNQIALEMAKAYVGGVGAFAFDAVMSSFERNEHFTSDGLKMPEFGSDLGSRPTEPHLMESDGQAGKSGLGGSSIQDGMNERGGTAA
jgi:RHS repeat-associated protein